MGLRALEIARGWIGTPYRHQASVRGAGADCLGLVRGVWRELHGGEAEAPPGYTRDWAEAGGEETLLAAAARHLDVATTADDWAGDVLVFRFRTAAPAKHCAIVSGEGRMIHALERVGVVEVAIGPWWRRRIAGRFRFRAAVGDDAGE